MLLVGYQFLHAYDPKYSITADTKAVCAVLIVVVLMFRENNESIYQ